MKCLLYLVHQFSWQPFQQTWPESTVAAQSGAVDEAVVVFLHAEEADVDNPKLVTKLVKQIKWLAGKRDHKTVVLHSFAHLSASNAPPAFTIATMNAAAERLQAVGFQVEQTPFGYTCAWQISVVGETLGKVFKSI